MRKCKSTILASALATVFVVLASPLAANAASGTANITAGSLSMTAPTTVTFAATLTGNDQTVTAPQAFDVLDGTGSGAGWKITATSTTFTSGGNTLPNSAVTVQAAPTVACDASTTCTLATTNVSYPYTLPAAAVAPTATTLVNATAATGVGGQTETASMRLAILASTKSGTYSSTWTYSIVSAP